MAKAVADPLRATDRARDQYRRPEETLAFFQVGPAMKVGEYAPGGGWYSRLLGLYLGPKGKLVGLFLATPHGFVKNLIILFYIQKFKIVNLFELVCRHWSPTCRINNADQHTVLSGRVMKPNWDISRRYIFNPWHITLLTF